MLLMRQVHGGATITGPALATFADRVDVRFEEALSLIAAIEDGEVRGEIRDSSGRALPHLYSVFLNEFILLHASQDETSTGILTSVQFHGVVDGALRARSA
jgi:hypothetical protein